MTINQDLAGFVKASLEQSLPRHRIQDVLLQAGWPADQAKAALSSFAEIDFPVPIPKPNASVSAREAFLYLVMFAALYTSAFSLGILVFQLINMAFPDPALVGQSLAVVQETIRWSVSNGTIPRRR